MKPVPQKHPMGCGVACVAYALKISYDEAIQNFAQPQNAWSDGYSCKAIVAALKKGGLHYKFKKAFLPKDKELLEREQTIVFTNYEGQYPYGHYLVRGKKGWMNPWVNCPIMIPVKAKIVKDLPAKPLWIFYQI